MFGIYIKALIEEQLSQTDERESQALVILQINASLTERCTLFAARGKFVFSLRVKHHTTGVTLLSPTPYPQKPTQPAQIDGDPTSIPTFPMKLHTIDMREISHLD